MVERVDTCLGGGGTKTRYSTNHGSLTEKGGTFRLELKTKRSKEKGGDRRGNRAAMRRSFQVTGKAEQQMKLKRGDRVLERVAAAGARDGGQE